MRHADTSDASAALHDAVARSLAQHIPEAAPVAVALSGGRDSVALLDALIEVAPARGHALAAFHVHHGLSPNADAWRLFCETLCAKRGVPFAWKAVEIERTAQSSLESEARRMRYDALAGMAHDARVCYVALAHHRDDQAETLLLQLLRGAGPHGLASMPELRGDPRGVSWLRPMLGVARAGVDGYMAARGLAFIEDESNASPKHLRNAIRQTVMPAIIAISPGAPVALARAAAHQSDAARLADEVAADDAVASYDGTTLDRTALASLAPHRARNLLRWFLRQHRLAAPSTARLSAMVAQLASPRDDSMVRLAHEGVELGIFRGRIHVHTASPPAFDLPWCGEAQLALPHGVLAFSEGRGTGIDVQRLAAAPVHVRGRAGGERMQVAANRPRRALKSILQDAGIPAWERQQLPLVYCGDALAAVAGIGVDTAFAAADGMPGITLEWRPSSR